MGIGTSLGAYFEDDFQHQAGVPTLPKGDESMVKKPKDTGDDNVLPPDEGSYDNKSGIIPISSDLTPLKKVYITGHSENNTNDSEETGIQPGIVDKLFGLNGVERYKLWPEKMIEDLFTTAGKVSKGEVPMWAMTPDGEFHTSVEGLEAAHKLMPAANSLPVTIQLRGAGLTALEEYHASPYDTQAHEQFTQLLRQVRRNQPSNIESPILSVEPPWTGRPVSRIHEDIHPDRMTDHDFYNWGEYQAENSMTPAQEARWVRLDEEHGARLREMEDDGLGLNPEIFSRAERRSYADNLERSEPSLAQEPYRWDHDEGPVEKPIDKVPSSVRPQVEEAMKDKPVKLFKSGDARYGEGTKYVFANKDGIGEMRLSEKKNGKQLYVHWIGTVDSHGVYDAHTFGGMKMKEVIRQLMDIYPNAETIKGFRVSGVRGRTGANDAEMRLPGRGNRHNQPPTERWGAEDFQRLSSEFE